MATIQVTPDMLRAKANEVQSLRGQHDEVMAKLTSLVHGLNEQWTGEAQTAFVEKFDSMQDVFRNFSELLEGYGKLMTTSANELEEKDAALKATINSFGV